MLVVVLALDDDEYDTFEAKRMKSMIEARPRLKSLHLLRNPPKEPLEEPKICHIKASMAEHAWLNGATWVIFLGDDVRVECPFSYRAIYRYYFLENQKSSISQRIHILDAHGLMMKGSRAFQHSPSWGGNILISLAASFLSSINQCLSIKI